MTIGHAREPKVMRRARTTNGMVSSSVSLCPHENVKQRSFFVEKPLSHDNDNGCSITNTVDVTYVRHEDVLIIIVIRAKSFFFCRYFQFIIQTEPSDRLVHCALVDPHAHAYVIWTFQRSRWPQTVRSPRHGV